YGLLSIGGIGSLILGSLLLFQSPVSYLRLALPVLIVFIILSIIFFAVVIGLAIKAHRKKVTTGKEGLIDEIGVATTDFDKEGTVMIHGELWNAESISNKINKGDKVRVIRIEGMKLIVKKE
ncbi:MAG: NfeD family protein, partial [candidate division WOR-3 bacterium]